MSNTQQATEELPLVSIVVPLLNEVDAIEHCVRSLGSQDYPLDCLEVLVVDGGSLDGSRERVADLMIDRPWLRLVENPDRRASAAFNRGIEASNGDVICLVGAHSEVGPDYVRRSVDALIESGAAGVGGRLLHKGTDATSRAIGSAMVSRFGMSSPFRFAADRRFVDTIGHPAYRRDAVEKTGSFDESLERNSDYEFNYRMREHGFDLLFDPEIVTAYHPRSSLRGLGRQFFDYGRAKATVLRRHPRSLQLRHMAPPLFALFTAASPFLLLSRRGRRLVAAAILAYSTGVTVAFLSDRPWEDGASPVVYAMAFPTMHLSWGYGLLSAMITSQP